MWSRFSECRRLSRLLQAARRRADKAQAEFRPAVERIGPGNWILRLIHVSQPRSKERPATNAKCADVAARKPPIHVATDVEEGAGLPGGRNFLCPSFSPSRPGCGTAFGIVVGEVESPWLARFSAPLPVTQQTFDLSAPHHPSDIFRIAGPCVRERCKNFGGETCHLGRVVAAEQHAAYEPPACTIRARCRWWHQEGPSACSGCSRLAPHTADALRLRWELDH